MKLDVNGNVIPKGVVAEVPVTRAALELKPVEYMTDEELFAIPTGSVFVYDIECYRNFFYIAFKCIATGKVVDFEISPDTTYNTTNCGGCFGAFASSASILKNTTFICFSVRLTNSLRTIS